MERYYAMIDEAFASLRGPQLEARLLAVADACREDRGADSLEYAAMLSELGGFYRGERKLDRSEEAFQAARGIFVRSGKQETPDYATLLNNLAGTHRVMGRHGEAERGFLAAMELYERTLGKGHVLYASALNNLSLLRLDQGDTARAETLQREASEILKALPEKRDEFASSLCNLGALCLQQKKYKQARDWLLDAVALYEDELGTDTPHYHSALNTLGIAWGRMGRLAEAADCFDRALAAARDWYGPEHPECVSLEANLAKARRLLEETR